MLDLNMDLDLGLLLFLDLDLDLASNRDLDLGLDLDLILGPHLDLGLELDLDSDLDLDLGLELIWVKKCQKTRVLSSAAPRGTILRGVFEGRCHQVREIASNTGVNAHRRQLAAIQFGD